MTVSHLFVVKVKVRRCDGAESNRSERVWVQDHRGVRKVHHLSGGRTVRCYRISLCTFRAQNTEEEEEVITLSQGQITVSLFLHV